MGCCSSVQKDASNLQLANAQRVYATLLHDKLFDKPYPKSAVFFVFVQVQK